MSIVLSDSAALVGRHMRHLIRIPEKLIGVTVMPIALVLVFGYLFGSAMEVPGGGDYREYIMAGIFVQMMLAGIGTTAIGVADDLNNGLVDRFRSLPMSQVAVLIGRTVSDLALTFISCIGITVVGLLIGWRPHGNALETVAAFGLLLLLGFAVSWLGVVLALLIRNPEAVSSITTFITMPLSFLSAAFIPLNNLPAWLRTIAEWNPISAVVSACRDLWGNPTAVTADSAFALRHPVPFALAGSVLLLAVMMPLATRAYRRAVAR
ncbi:ABC transporter permease [Streptomyces sp. NPDC058682]|uniref:ABC transporter permease n=1 Tax=unclassified Streptomyces TaxID=2593676 RepID=UPI002259ABC4|nr:ABC transporter permease [Streptomyces sp. NBC_01214]MCX4803077.1 ABC transporter permease [Streptomyces sp. NBC_01214]